MKVKKNGDETKSKAQSEAVWIEYNYQSGTFDEEVHGRGAFSSKLSRCSLLPVLGRFKATHHSTTPAIRAYKHRNRKERILVSNRNTSCYFTQCNAFYINTTRDCAAVMQLAAIFAEAYQCNALRQ